MHASVQGALAQINKSWKAFTHKGKPMTKEQVTKVLIYANNKGYKSTAELSDEEIDKVLSTIQAVIPNGGCYKLYAKIKLESKHKTSAYGLQHMLVAGLVI